MFNGTLIDSLVDCFWGRRGGGGCDGRQTHSSFGVNGAKISSKRLYFIDHGFVNVLGSYLAPESESNDIGNSVR